MRYLLTLFMTIAIGWNSFACDCIMTPIENHIKETQFIITAQVIELLDTMENEHYFENFDPTRSYRVKVRIMSSYKGGLLEGQIIELGSDFSNCSIYFNNNGKYLLFLDKYKISNKYFQKICSYSAKLEDAKHYIKIIEKKTKYKLKK